MFNTAKSTRMPSDRPGITRKGFTLIELLVVIAIIALLAAILFPVFARARENARRSSCQSNLKQLALGVHQYIQDYDEKLPIVSWLSTDGGPQGAFMGSYMGSWTTGWPDEIFPYIKNTQVYYCPSNIYAGRYATTSGQGYLGMISYGMSKTLNGANYVDNCSGSGSYAVAINTSQPLAAVRSSANVVLLADIFQLSPQYTGFTMSPGNSASYPYYYLPPNIEEAQTAGTTFGNAYQSYLAAGYHAGNYLFPAPIGRHFGGANVAYVDGHVKFAGPKTPGMTLYDQNPTACRPLWNPSN